MNKLCKRLAVIVCFAMISLLQVLLVAEGWKSSTNLSTCDFTSRMTSLSDMNGSVFVREFDGKGNRLSQSLNDCRSKRFVYDGADVLLELNPSNEVAYAWINGEGIDPPVERFLFRLPVPFPAGRVHEAMGHSGRNGASGRIGAVKIRIGRGRPLPPGWNGFPAKNFMHWWMLHENPLQPGNFRQVVPLCVKSRKPAWKQDRLHVVNGPLLSGGGTIVRHLSIGET